MSLKSIREWGSRKRETTAVYRIIKRHNRIKLTELSLEIEKTGVGRDELRVIVDSLMNDGKVYKPCRGVLECVEY